MLKRNWQKDEARGRKKAHNLSKIIYVLYSIICSNMLYGNFFPMQVGVRRGARKHRRET